jgi:beta-glucosidase-like glycosyl hydrolase
VQCIRAGADMYLVCRKEEYVLICYEAVLREAERDRKFALQLSAAAQRIIRFKNRAPALKKVAPPPTEKTVTKLRKAMEDFRREVEKANAS